jgi:hypothetical protein
MKQFWFVFPLFMIACDSIREAEFTGKTIEINFNGEFDTNDWIEIDGIRFEHQLLDTTGVVKATYDPLNGYHDHPIKSNVCIIPPTTVYVGLIDTWGQFVLNQAQLAYYFTAVFNRVMNSPAQRYEFLSNELVLFGGKVTFVRTDNSSIHIKTSKNYPALISVIN